MTYMYMYVHIYVHVYMYLHVYGNVLCRIVNVYAIVYKCSNNVIYCKNF